MKLYTIDRNPKSKSPFVRGQNPTIPSLFSPNFTPVMHCQWQGLSTTVSNHVDRLWRLIGQRTLLDGRYTGRGVAQTSRVRGRRIPTPPPFLPFHSLHPSLSSLLSLHLPLLFPTLPSSFLPSLQGRRHDRSWHVLSSYAVARICHGNSACLSVCPSITRVLWIKMAERIIEILSRPDRPVILVCRHQGSLRKSDCFAINGWGGGEYNGG